MANTQERLERIARNESRFREVNEQIEAGRDASDGSLVGFVCECGYDDCRRLVELSSLEYERVRANPRHFAVIPGHEIPEAEFITGRNDRYFVVEKRSSSAAVAEELDPRS